MGGLQRKLTRIKMKNEQNRERWMKIGKKKGAMKRKAEEENGAAYTTHIHSKKKRCLLNGKMNGLFVHIDMVTYTLWKFKWHVFQTYDQLLDCWMLLLYIYFFWFIFRFCGFDQVISRFVFFFWLLFGYESNVKQITCVYVGGIEKRKRETHKVNRISVNGIQVQF